MNESQFKLALERLRPSDWEYFEELCSKFLVSEFANLRTMASPSGDGGRDSEIFSPELSPIIAIQYSVTKYWPKKIRKTVETINKNFKDVRVVIYLTNQKIGGQADELKREMLNLGYHLDVRDYNWFMERAHTDAVREAAAKTIIDQIARPYLEGEKLLDRKSSPLTSEESKAALLYLGLQWQDDISQKGLTKLSFDALVRAALRNSNSNNRKTRQYIHAYVSSVLSSANVEIIKTQVNSALNRLSKRYAKHWEKQDEFCLSHDEQKRIMSRVADNANEEESFKNIVEEQCECCLAEITKSAASDKIDLVERVPRILEQLLFVRGEDFVASIMNDTLHLVETKQLSDIIFKDINSARPSSAIIANYPDLIKTIIQSLLREGKSPVRNYLRRLANSYTLLTFLNHTPNIKSATNKLFSRGVVWIDTTVLLPILAERIFDDQSTWRLTNALSACRDAGIKWKSTTGIIQEIVAHMKKAELCSRFNPIEWRGRIPYLYNKFLSTGRSAKEFQRWLERFKGNEQPEDDIAQFLYMTMGIEKVDLLEEARNVEDELRHAAERLWTEAHQERRGLPDGIDSDSNKILTDHDLETYLGVISLRQSEQANGLGYKHWLLTLDRNAWIIRDRLKRDFSNNIPTSPLMSLSYLLNITQFGGLRSMVGHASDSHIPLLLDIELSEYVPKNLLELAESVRKENNGLPDYIIQRKVRDAINQAKRRAGCSVNQENYMDSLLD